MVKAGNLFLGVTFSSIKIIGQFKATTYNQDFEKPPKSKCPYGIALLIKGHKSL
jgi:hypothetical protein